jgi:serine/threonine protein kinase/WD40 repeat protein/tetratricopeptide (TPR) repeat protein
MNPDFMHETTVPASDTPAEPDATIRVDVRATLPPGLEQPSDMIGRYKLIEPLGEGGFGSVWRAEQFEPIHREVALKVIKAGMDSREIIARFEAERQALAMMDHPNIAAVLDAGTTESGRPFFAMELVKGMPLTEFCDARKLTIRQRLELFIPVCQAVQHAHQKAILHRDLKPSNILVVEVDGKPVPKVIDFGIAKALGGTEEQALQASLARTQAGMIIGTPQYMSPEQAGAEPDLDTRSDIYTLGVILYELLVGDTPLGREQMRKAAMDEIMRMIRESDAKRPSSRLMPTTEAVQTAALHRQSDTKRLGNTLRGDLDWIVLKALEKDRDRRYETANALALDLQRHLHDEPVSAGPPSAGYRLKKLVRRNKAVFAAAAAVVLALAAGLALALRGEARARTEARRSDDMLMQMRLQRAEELLAADDVSGIAYLADVLRRHPEDRITASRLLSALRDRNHPQLATPPLKHESTADIVGWSGDCQFLFTGTRKTLTKWDARSGRKVLEMRRDESVNPGLENFSFKLSPDCSRAFSFISYDRARVWDTATGKPALPDIQFKLSWKGSEFTGPYGVFSPDGRLLALTTSTHVVSLCDARTGREIAGIKQKDNLPIGMAFSPDSGMLAVTYQKGQVFFYETAAGTEKMSWTMPAPAAPLSNPIFAMEGQALVCRELRGGRVIFILALDSMPLKHRTQEVNSVIESIAIKNDGRTLAAASVGEKVRFFDISKGESEGFNETGEYVYDASFSANGLCHLARLRQAVQVWSQGRIVTRTRAYDSSVQDAMLNTEGSILAVALASGEVHLWRTISSAAWPLVLPVDAPDGGSGTQSVSLHPDGKLAAVLEGNHHRIRLWDLQSGICRHPSIETTKRFFTLSFDASGKHLWTGGDNNTIHEWDWNQARTLREGPRIKSYIRYLDLSDDGRKIAVVADFETKLFEPEGKPGNEIEIPAHSRSFTTQRGRFISADGNLIFGTKPGSPGAGLMWDVRRQESVSAECMHDNDIGSMSKNIEGSLIATASDDGAARVWHVPSGTPASPWLRHPAYAGWLSFAPAEDMLASACRDGKARLWDITSGHVIGQPMAHEETVYCAEFSPQGRRVATASYDQTVRLWHAPSGRPLTEPLRCRFGFNTRCEWIEGGRRLLSYGVGSPHIWDVVTLDSDAPAWLPDWAEAVAGSRLNAQGLVEGVSVEAMDHFPTLSRSVEGNDVFCRTLRWFYANPATRPISPDAEITRDELLRNIAVERTPEMNSLLLSVDPLNPAAQAWRLINLSQRLSKFSEADEAYLVKFLPDLMRQSGGNHPVVWRAKAAVDERLGRLEDALTACTRALELNPGDAATLEQMAGLQHRAKQPDKAANLAHMAFKKAGENEPYNIIDRPKLRVVLRNSLKVAGRLAEAGEANLELLGIQERRPSEATANQVDLSLYYNGRMEDEYFGGTSGHNYTAVSRGVNEFAGVRFDVRGLIRLRARSKEFGTDPSKRLPDLEKSDAVKGIVIQAPCRKLHFLHTGESVYSGAELGAYIAHYADGTSQAIPIQAFTNTQGKVPNLADRYFSSYLASQGKPVTPPPPLVVAWQGPRPPTHPPQKVPSFIWLYLLTWDNPRPEVRIESIDFISHGADGGPCLFAISKE